MTPVIILFQFVYGNSTQVMPSSVLQLVSNLSVVAVTINKSYHLV